MFLDTSGLLFYLHRDEPAHERAVMHMDAARRMITHNYVLVEFIALADARRIPRRRRYRSSSTSANIRMWKSAV